MTGHELLGALRSLPDGVLDMPVFTVGTDGLTPVIACDLEQRDRNSRRTDVPESYLVVW